MSTPRVTLTMEISSVLYDVLLIEAAMAATTVPAIIASTLRATQVAFFATPTPEDENPENDVVVLDVRAAATPINHAETAQFSSTRRRGELGGVQRDILDHLLDAPLSPDIDDVFDVLVARRALLSNYQGPAISRAVHQLIGRGVLEPVVPTGAGFRPDDGAGNRVQYVRLQYVRLRNDPPGAISQKVPPAVPRGGFGASG